MIGISINLSNVLKEVYSIFQPFRPQARAITIDYQRQVSVIELVIHVPPGIRRKIKKIEIPGYKGFRITRVLDELFNNIEPIYNRKEDKWIIDTKNLPSSENFLVVMEGNISQNFLNRLIRIQPAENRDSTENYDKFWLSCMFKDHSLLEEIWKAVSVENIPVNVKISIRKTISTVLPEDIKKALEITKEWLAIGKSRDRRMGKLIDTKRKYQRTLSKAPSVDELIDFIQRITDSKFFRKYLEVDHPFSLGNIKLEERGFIILPEKISTEAITHLDLKVPVATGYLTFKKKGYINDIRDELNNFL